MQPIQREQQQVAAGQIRPELEWNGLGSQWGAEPERVKATSGPACFGSHFREPSKTIAIVSPRRMSRSARASERAGEEAIAKRLTKSNRGLGTPSPARCPLDGHLLPATIRRPLRNGEQAAQPPVGAARTLIILSAEPTTRTAPVRLQDHLSEEATGCLSGSSRGLSPPEFCLSSSSLTRSRHATGRRRRWRWRPLVAKTLSSPMADTCRMARSWRQVAGHLLGKDAAECC